MLEGFEMVVLVLQKTYRRDEVRTNRGKKNFGDLTMFQSGRVGKSRSRHSKCKTYRMIIAVGFRVGLEDIRFSLTFT